MKDSYLHIFKNYRPNNYNAVFDEYQGKAEYLTHIEIDTRKWLDFAIENIDEAKITTNSDFGSSPEYKLQGLMGRGPGNTEKLKFDGNYSSNQLRLLTEQIGNFNIRKLGLRPDSLKISHLIHKSGHGTLWHNDIETADLYLEKLRKQTGRVKTRDDIKRVWFSVVPWSWGQIFQLGDQVLTLWEAGDVYTFPFDIPHATMNFGFDLKYSVGVIGEKL